MKYSFYFSTGFGYREISAHTIKTYCINVNANSIQEAITKINKKRKALTKFNEVFDRSYCAFENDCIVGLVDLKYEIIKYQGEEIIVGPLVIPFTYQLSRYKIRQPEFSVRSDHGWVKTHIFGSFYLSYYHYLLKRRDEYKYTKLLFGPDNRYKELYLNQIDIILGFDLNEEERKQILKLKEEQ